MARRGQSQSTSLSIQRKIERALSLHDTWEASLRHDPNIFALLEKLQRDIERTKNAMVALGVVAECKHCEEVEGGSCCGVGIENRYDEILLLINLLLGVSLPTRAQCANSCYLLGKDGCTLAARHVLCVNYICSKLRRRLSRDELMKLQTCAGEELNTEFVLHEAVKKRLRAAR